VSVDNARHESLAGQTSNQRQTLQIPMTRRGEVQSNALNRRVRQNIERNSEIPKI
jgi:hypothetical protein